MSIDILKQDIRSGTLKQVYAFYGPEEYLKKYYIESIEKLVVDKAMKDLNRIVLEGKVDARKIMDSCEACPVFSDKKLIIVKNSGLLKGGKKETEASKKSQSQGGLPEYLQNMPSYAYLVFLEEEIDKRLKLTDAVKKSGLLVEFAYQKPVDLVKWVIKVCKSMGRIMDASVASYLVEISEQGMTEIYNEIQKLVMYTEGRQSITQPDVDRICTRSVKSRIFDLTDAIAEQDAVKGLKLLNDMLMLKEPLPKILFMITKQLRQILEVRLLQNKGYAAAQVASEMGLPPFIASKLIKQSSRFSEDRLKKAMEESLEYDIAIKTGKIDEKIAVELMITSFSK